MPILDPTSSQDTPSSTKAGSADEPAGDSPADPPSTKAPIKTIGQPIGATSLPVQNSSPEASSRSGLFGWFKGLRKGRGNGNGSVRDTLEELIEEHDEVQAPFGEDERTLLQNILTVRQKTVADVMVPRADITAIEATTAKKEVIQLIGDQGHSRLPVYRETLDDVIGMIHIKDLLTAGGKRSFKLTDILRKVLFVAPSMQVLELLLEMRVTRSHMALVVDEFGGVDGLVTIEDLVEEIVGEIEDEHDVSDEPSVAEGLNGNLIADARLTIEALEEKLGPVVTDEEREDVDTLGGLVFSMLGRVPIRGELIEHPSGWEFEVLEADPRRIRRLCVRHPGEECAPALPPSKSGGADTLSGPEEAAESKADEKPRKTKGEAAPKSETGDAG